MNKILVIVGMVASLSLSASSLTKASAAEYQPSEVLKNLQGCFQVSYRYVEDGAHDLDLKGDLFEYVTYEGRSSSQFFQHYGIQENQAMKHWSEEWSMDAQGNQVQQVFSPSGALRYTCTAPMVANQVRCYTTNSPKPTRDWGRNDYATLDRENTLQFTPKGWVQAENNIKRDAAGKMIANEIGWNEYKRVDEKNCAPAIHPQTK